MRLRPYVLPSRAVYSSRAERALIVMPFSRSRSIESRTWLVIWRASIVCVSSSRRSASVDFPWSIWAMIEKLRRRSCGIVIGPLLGPSPAHQDEGRPDGAEPPDVPAGGFDGRRTRRRGGRSEEPQGALRE